MAKIKIIKNDTVIVTTGNSKGVKGKVIKVFPK
jgi:ribosomal protein L24